MTCVFLVLFILMAAGTGGTEKATPTPVPRLPQKVKIFTLDEFYLEGEYVKPASPDKPVVVMLHQLGRTRSTWTRFKNKLQEVGYGTLDYDARGHGRSVIRKGKRATYEMFASTGQYNDWNMMSNDLRQVVGVLKDIYKVETKRVIIIGASIGANVTLKLAAKNKDVKGIILLSPGLNYHDVTSEPPAKEWDGRPCFIACAKGDAYSYESCQKLKEVMEKGAGTGKSRIVLEVMAGNEHGTDMLGGALDEKIMTWLKDLAK
ncbi:MAG: alpha/beta fold hydrolase [Candidatus Sumerlaeota bacterium]|nr:alpha/beta fold hydrolase [Candidatus Sumerlaeota bacterium]